MNMIVADGLGKLYNRVGVRLLQPTSTFQLPQTLRNSHRDGQSQQRADVLDDENAAFPRTVLSGIQPTGVMHLGNYLGAVRKWKEMQNAEQNVNFSIVDMHSITLPQDPAALRNNILEMAATILACGIDPAQSTIFIQSAVKEHCELCWILSCLTTMARLSHLPQYKEKTRKMKDIPLGLYLYPVLQAADIMLYKTTHVPVGEDQVQHIQLAQHLARTFNSRFGPTFPIPHAIIDEKHAARIRSLRDPAKKMSKSDVDPKATVFLLDEPEVIVEKFKKAVTDFTSDVTYSPGGRPGVSNLIAIHHLVTGTPIDRIVAEARSIDTGRYKLRVADAVVAHLAPIRTKIRAQLENRSELIHILECGADKARQTAEATMSEVKLKVGLGTPSVQPLPEELRRPMDPADSFMTAKPIEKETEIKPELPRPAQSKIEVPEVPNKFKLSKKESTVYASGVSGFKEATDYKMPVPSLAMLNQETAKQHGKEPGTSPKYENVKHPAVQDKFRDAMAAEKKHVALKNVQHKAKQGAFSDAKTAKEATCVQKDPVPHNINDGPAYAMFDAYLDHTKAVTEPMPNATMSHDNISKEKDAPFTKKEPPKERLNEATAKQNAVISQAKAISQAQQNAHAVRDAAANAKQQPKGAPSGKNDAVESKSKAAAPNAKDTNEAKTASNDKVISKTGPQVTKNEEITNQVAKDSSPTLKHEHTIDPVRALTAAGPMRASVVHGPAISEPSSAKIAPSLSEAEKTKIDTPVKTKAKDLAASVQVDAAHQKYAAPVVPSPSHSAQTCSAEVPTTAAPPVQQQGAKKLDAKN